MATARLVLALMLIGVGVQAKGRARHAENLRAKSLRDQVRRAKPELQTQKRLEDFHASPYHPSQIVERIHALESSTAWTELCTELAQLPDDELELFEDEIRKPEHARRMHCAPALLARLDAYWKVAERRLAAAHPVASTIPRLARCARSTRGWQPRKLGSF